MARRASSRRRRRQWAQDWPALPPEFWLAKLDAELVAEGWTRAGNVRVYRAGNGLFTVRFVWRRRADGLSQTHEVVFRHLDAGQLAAGPEAA